MRPAFKWNLELCDTAGQTPGTRRNGTDLKTAAEKAIAALERMAPIVEPEEPLPPPSRPAIPPPPVEVETQVATELPTVIVTEPAVPAAPAELAAEPAASPQQTIPDDTLGTIRPVEIDDEPVIPVYGFQPSARQAWIGRGLVAGAALLVASLVLRSAISEGPPAMLGKAVHAPRVVVTGAAETPTADEAGEPVPVESLAVEAAISPKKNKAAPGSAAFFAPEAKPSKQGAGRTSFERVPFGSIPSREDEPMGVYPFLVRDKAPEDPAPGPLPPPPPAR